VRPDGPAGDAVRVGGPRAERVRLDGKRAGTSRPGGARPQTASPARLRPETAAPVTAGTAAAPVWTRSATLPRRPFAMLILALLGGGLVCLLIINTTLGAASFKISQLQDNGTALAQQEQSLQRQIADEKSPAQIERRAHQLGMRQPDQLNFVDLRTHRVCRLSGQAGAPGQAGCSATLTGGGQSDAASLTGTTGTAGPATAAKTDKPAKRHKHARKDRPATTGQAGTAQTGGQAGHDQ
jgi:hypothetical protein